MTYIVSSGALNSAHSLTCSLVTFSGTWWPQLSQSHVLQLCIVLLETAQCTLYSVCYFSCETCLLCSHQFAFVSYLSQLLMYVISFVSASCCTLTDVTDAWILLPTVSFFCCFFSTLFLLWWLFTSPRLRKSGGCGREASLRHVLRSYGLRWRRSIFGHRPGSFTSRQTGDWCPTPGLPCWPSYQRQWATSPAVCLYPLVSVSVSIAASNCVTFVLLNMRSLNNKLDDVLEIMRDRSVDVFCITESWHDTDSAFIGRLRSASYNFVDRPRPRGDDGQSWWHCFVFNSSQLEATYSRPADNVRAAVCSCCRQTVHCHCRRCLPSRICNRATAVLQWTQCCFRAARHLSGTYLHSGWFHHSPRLSSRFTLGSVLSLDRLLSVLWFNAASHRCHAPVRWNIGRGDFEGGRWPSWLSMLAYPIIGSSGRLRQRAVKRPSLLSADCCRSWRQLDIDQSSCRVLAVVIYTLPTRHLANRRWWHGCCVWRRAQWCTWLADSFWQLFNRSLVACHFPGRFKDAFVTPIIK